MLIKCGYKLLQLTNLHMLSKISKCDFLENYYET